MSELVSIVVSLFVTAVIASLASSILFGDYREGFRILYQMLGSTDSNPGPSDVPKEPKSSLFVQIAFGAGCLVAASICYVALSPVFARFEVLKVGSQFRSKGVWISIEFPHRSAQQGARANAGSCHAVCDGRSFEMKNRNAGPSAAHGAPAPVVAHL